MYAGGDGERGMVPRSADGWVVVDRMRSFVLGLGRLDEGEKA